MDNGKHPSNEDAIKITTQYQAGILKDELDTEWTQVDGPVVLTTPIAEGDIVRPDFKKIRAKLKAQDDGVEYE